MTSFPSFSASWPNIATPPKNGTTMHHEICAHITQKHLKSPKYKAANKHSQNSSQHLEPRLTQQIITHHHPTYTSLRDNPQTNTEKDNNNSSTITPCKAPLSHPKHIPKHTIKPSPQRKSYPHNRPKLISHPSTDILNLRSGQPQKNP